MNKETYQALKRVINGTVKNEDIEFEDIEKVVDWIDEVAKEYEEKTCDKCGVKMTDLEYANRSEICFNCK